MVSEYLRRKLSSQSAHLPCLKCRSLRARKGLLEFLLLLRRDSGDIVLNTLFHPIIRATIGPRCLSDTRCLLWDFGEALDRRVKTGTLQQFRHGPSIAPYAHADDLERKVESPVQQHAAALLDPSRRRFVWLALHEDGM